MKKFINLDMEIMLITILSSCQKQCMQEVLTKNPGVYIEQNVGAKYQKTESIKENPYNINSIERAIYIDERNNIARSIAVNDSAPGGKIISIEHSDYTNQQGQIEWSEKLK